MRMQLWVRLPSGWIEDGGLRELKWGRDGKGADNAAALMALAVIAHYAEESSGVAQLTYESACSITGLSRSKFANGLDVLEGLKVIERTLDGRRSTYKLANYNLKGGWAKFPARTMYQSGIIKGFEDFRLRRATELNALKLFFLFVARRGRDTNYANISFEKIESYSGVDRSKIKAATSLLAANSLVYIDRLRSQDNEFAVSNAYRIVGLESYNHMGTMGRQSA
jgi:hypothetical protein